MSRNGTPEMLTQDMHGTLKAYNHYHCRCAECRQASREYRLNRIASMTPEENAARLEHNRQVQARRPKPGPLPENIIESLDGEEWRPVLGFEGLYEVSNLGRVKSLPRDARNRGHLLKLRPSKAYYGAVLYRDGRPRRKLVHRLVLEAFESPCPDGMECCHRDGNPRNNVPENLYWGTHLQNMQDRVRHGGYPRQSHCIHGHEFTPENTAISKYNGQRICKQCRTAAGRRKRANRAA